YLQERGQRWREDASNASDDYLRNRVRRLLAERGDLHSELLELGEACFNLRAWARSASPILNPMFATSELADMPPILARESAARWLIDRGVRPDEISPQVITRLIQMATD